MAKKRVICPECGHRHTIQIGGVKGRTSGVRAHKITGKQVEYTITAPVRDIETGHFSNVTDDLILTGAFGLITGGTCGLVASLTIPDYAIQMIGIGGSAGVTLAWFWLLAETNQRLKQVLPWFVEQKSAWQAGAAQADPGDGVALTIDHRYRDGLTEAGRTIQYFGILPVDLGRFNSWAQDALRGDSLAIANWTGKDKMFSRLEYDKLLSQLQAGGTVMNLPGKGNALTGGGQRALQRHLKTATPPTISERA